MSSGIPRTANLAYCRREGGYHYKGHVHTFKLSLETTNILPPITVHRYKVGTKIEFKGDLAELNVIEYCQHHVPLSINLY
jgi:hypothetical protein